MSDNCLIVINTLAGNYKSLDIEKLKRKLLLSYSDITVKYIPRDGVLANAVGYSAVAVCGGDGTLNSLINWDTSTLNKLYYVPCGTLNEVYDGGKRDTRISSVGSANEKLFSYVLATGTFTPLGYVVDNASKQRFKVLAYLSRVLKEYKVCSIKAKITADGKTRDGDYTLIMAINSTRCFGFRFNKMHEDGKLCLLTIRSPGKDNLINRIKIFFPFFRAFFIGFKKPYSSENMCFMPFDELHIETESPTVFCADGEKAIQPASFDVKIKKLKNPITIVT